MPTFAGTPNDDVINGGNASDTIIGGDGGDTLDGRGGDDTIASDVEIGEYNRPYYGNPWTAPNLDTGTEIDIVNGGNGNDTLSVGYGDIVDGGAGTDYLLISLMGATAGVTADFRTNQYYDLTTETYLTRAITIDGAVLANVEEVLWIEGSNYNDTIWANTEFGNFAPVFGMGGDDVIYAQYYTGSVFGGDGDDTLDLSASAYGLPAYGDAGHDIIIGGGGYESLYGGEGNDTISGNYGFDNLFGGDGDDILDGGSFGDRIYGEVGNDTIYGAGDDDTIDGGEGDDVIYGDYSPNGSPSGITSGNNDILWGGAGSDTLYGDEESDTLFSAGSSDSYDDDADLGVELDQLFGGDGNDTLLIGIGDSADGGNGTDTLHLSLGGLTEGISITIGDDISAVYAFAGVTVTNVERVSTIRGSELADFITIESNANRLTVDGGGGDDFIVASDQSDILRGGEGFDIIDYSNASGGVRVDLGRTNRSQDTLASGRDDLLGFEAIIGSDFNDRLTMWAYEFAGQMVGGAGDDILTVYGAIDAAIEGGSGNDRYIIDNRAAIIIELADGGIDEIRSSDDVEALADNVENLRLIGGGTIATGNALDNAIWANIYDSIIDGAAGNDRIYGKNASDTLTGDEGNDMIRGGGAVDNIYGGLGDDRLYGDAGSDKLYGGAGRDLMAGGAGNDRFIFDEEDFAGLTAGTADRILDFTSGSHRIVLGSVDANTTIQSNQAFAFIGTAAFTNVAGQLRYEQVGNTTMIYGDTNGDGVADLAIALTGALSLTAADFVL